MALPATDDFNRANEVPLSNGGKWSNPLGAGGDSQLGVFSNFVYHDIAGGTKIGWMYWNADTFGANQSSQLVQLARPAGFTIGPAARIQTAGSVQSGYWGTSDDSGRSMLKVVAGVFTNLGVSVGSVADGDVLKLTTVDTQITLYQNVINSSSTNDGTFASGQAGIGIYGNGSHGDDWVADNISPVAGPASVLIGRQRKPGRWSVSSPGGFF